MIEVPETHTTGFVEIHNLEIIQQWDLRDAHFGLQVAPDGRVWVCINGVALLRFKPHRKARHA
jgi:hypothetical protein